VIICLGDVRADVRQWDDRTEAQTAVSGPLHVLGDADANENPFVTVRLESMRDPRRVLTVGGGTGPGSLQPVLLGLVWAGRVWVGAGNAAYAIDLAAGTVREYGFESPFVEFFVSAAAGVLVVTWETGIRGYGPDGTQLWQHDTDLIEDVRWSPTSLVVEQMDRPPLEIPLPS